MNTSLSEDIIKPSEDWLGFIKFGKEPVNLRGNILASWKRCKDLNVNPYGRINSNILAAKEFQEKLREKNNLIEVVKPYMENIYNIVAGSGFIVFLTDNEATILYVLGDQETLKYFSKKYHFNVGAIWSEKYVGTSSVGMVLAEGKPIQILGEEHYCLEHQRWTCSGVPIKNPQGKIIAVLSMAGSSEKVHPHTLGMLVASEMAIENQIQILEAYEKLSVTTRYHKAVVESVSEGILTIDANGIITFMNKSAEDILLTTLKEAQGKHITQIVDFRPQILDVLKTGEGYVDKEFIINSKKGRMHFIKSAIPIIDENGKINCVVDIFREIKQVKRLVNQMVGAHARFTFNDILGSSKDLLEAKRLAITAAKSSSNVLLLGESGTGKELFAQAIHNASHFSQGPFIAVNCGAIPRDLIESEFFGYEEGAFTGARQGGRPGKFELASGGTIFLDEIGEMPLDMQVRLLRVLQEKRVTRIGGTKTIPVDVRVIAATNKELTKEMQEGNFRKDLFWRLNVITINIPLLNKRKEDIPCLAQHFLTKHSKEDSQYTIHPKTMEILKDYSWPGNIRELENALERAINFAEQGLILPQHLPKNIIAEPEGQFSSNDKIYSLEDIEKRAIHEVLTFCQGNMSQAARMLGIARNTLYHKIEKHKLNC